MVAKVLYENQSWLVKFFQLLSRQVARIVQRVDAMSIAMRSHLIWITNG